MNRQRRRPNRNRGNNNNSNHNNKRRGNAHHKSSGRPTSANMVRSNIYSGLSVSIVKKEDQKSGQLTHGKVSMILTNSEIHPRGIKVKLMNGMVGRVQQINQTEDKEDRNSLVNHTSHDYNYGTLEEHFNCSPNKVIFHHDFEVIDGRKNWMQATNFESPRSSGENMNLASEICDNYNQEFCDKRETFWDCKACTFRNSAFLSVCEICDTQNN
eukprot:Awhi_evm1s13138